MKNKMLRYISLSFSGLLFLILTGLMIPTLPFFGETGTLLESFFALHLFLGSIFFGWLSYWSFKKSAVRTAKIAVLLSLINIVGFSVPIIALTQTARKYHTDISWLKVQMEMGSPDLLKSVKYATADGKDLYMDVSKPSFVKGNNKLKPVILVHGGGFVSGTRNQEPAWTKFFNDRGYIVFDVDYRLANKNYPTWNKAAADIASAIVWMGDHASVYNLDMDKLIIAGSSAGGALALQVAYGIHQPCLVVAVYPAADISALWKENSGFYGITSRAMCEEYIGGSPQQFPAAYAAVDVSNKLSAQYPATLLIVGEEDHLIPFKLQKDFADKINRAGITNEFVALPFTDHFFTIASGSLGSQIAFKVTSDFLDKK